MRTSPIRVRWSSSATAASDSRADALADRKRRVQHSERPRRVRCCSRQPDSGLGGVDNGESSLLQWPDRRHAMHFQGAEGGPGSTQDVGVRIAVGAETVQFGGGVQAGRDRPSQGQFGGRQAGRHRDRLRSRWHCSCARHRAIAARLPRNCVRTVPQLDDVAAAERSAEPSLAQCGANLRPGERRALRGGEFDQLTREPVAGRVLFARSRADGGGHRRSLAHPGPTVTTARRDCGSFGRSLEVGETYRAFSGGERAISRPNSPPHSTSPDSAGPTARRPRPGRRRWAGGAGPDPRGPRRWCP